MIIKIFSFVLLAVGVLAAYWAMRHNPYREQTEFLNQNTYAIAMALALIGIVGGGLLQIS